MSAISRGLERKFAFDLPVEPYPNILIRLRGTPVRLEQLTHSPKQEILTAKADGKWSIQENASHLLDLETLWLTRLSEFLAGAQVLSAADIKQFENRPGAPQRPGAEGYSDGLQQGTRKAG